MKPRPHMQRRAAHKARKALPRALHHARAGRVAFLRQLQAYYRDRSIFRKPPRIWVSKHLLPHKSKIALALTVHGA